MAQTQSSNASNTLAVVLGTNQIVERCFAKMANDVTAQVRDKLIDIILAVIARECQGVDVELLRRLINAEIPDPNITIEKRVKTQDPESKTKTVELDAEGNPIKRARKEKAPKAPKEPKAPKAVLTEEEKAALKAEKEAAKAVAKEAAKAARQLERDAAKAAKALADAEKPAKPAKEPKAPKEVRLPIPWCGVAIADRCHALRSYHGLFAQCVADKTETGEFCAACEKAGAPFGTVAMRAACGVFDYVAPNGKKCVRLANVITKFGHATEQLFQEEADEHNITIPYEHLEKEVKQRGRPKSLSPRATKGKGKVATTDTTPASSRTASDADNSDTETETDEPVTVAAAKAPKATGEKKQKQQQARKKVEKTADAAAAAAADAEAPKKRGRPAKAKEPVIEVNASLIQDLVSSASGRASDAAPSSEELVEELITPCAASPATPAKKAASPVTAPAAPKKVNALKKKARVTEVVEGMTLWVESFEGNKIWVHPETLAVYDASNGEGVGTWDDAAKTIIFEDDEETEIDQFSEEE
jgi:chemotaxis protein histidine kinase CheA